MGCAMGTICAPSYANIFMAKFEEKYIYPYIKELSLLYLRYTDDIFIIWKGSKEELIKFINELNQKHNYIKFDYEFSTKKIPFLDTMVYIDTNNKLQTTLYRKPTDQQAYLHAKSEHPKSLKNSIAYSQTLRIKTICSTENEYQKHCTILKEKLIEREYKEKTLKKQIEKVNQINRKELLQTNNKHSEKTNMIPLVLTYNRTLPNISNVVKKNWNILQINPHFHHVFGVTPTLAFKRNKNIQELIGGNLIRNGKLVRRNKNQNEKGKSMACNTTRTSLCCTQVVNTNTFKSNQTNRVFNIYHEITCKSQWVIYLLECILCNIQYVGKSETPFNIRLNNHRKDVNSPKAIPACLHFRKERHNFLKHARFTLIEELSEKDNISKETLKLRLKQRENFWILKLQTLTPKGLNQELNKI